MDMENKWTVDVLLIYRSAQKGRLSVHCVESLFMVSSSRVPTGKDKKITFIYLERNEHIFNIFLNFCTDERFYTVRIQTIHSWQSITFSIAFHSTNV